MLPHNLHPVSAVEARRESGMHRTGLPWPGCWQQKLWLLVLCFYKDAVYNSLILNMCELVLHFFKVDLLLLNGQSPCEVWCVFHRYPGCQPPLAKSLHACCLDKGSDLAIYESTSPRNIQLQATCCRQVLAIAPRKWLPTTQETKSLLLCSSWELRNLASKIRSTI